ncbi:MAG TPA: hypothetical protein VMF06_15905 [Candidatus Limnocylindria bacterium]|jgi:O-antigen/teichoic acid export membrane protein|nr:hypothetical protein [Candidatus Limnocylindria bacterium]
MADKAGSFFRQGAWMVMATLLGGVGMTFVHTFLNARLSFDQYSQFKSLLGIFYILGAPQTGIWTLFAQQTAMAVTPEQVGAVGRAARQTALAIGVLMGLVAIYILFRGETLARDLKLEGVSALWATWGLMLATLWLAICRGILQGKQDFFTFGWVSILDGLGRAGGIVFVVLLFHAHAAGAIVGALIGNLAALALGGWALLPILSRPGSSPNWRKWLGVLVPLTLIGAALQTLSQLDLIFLRGIIPQGRIDEFDLGQRYAPAQTLGFALTQFTVPLALVMFPKVARSRATSEKSNALQLTLLTTAVLGGVAALAMTILPWLPVKILFPRADSAVASLLVPWFGWAMLAFTLANVLISNLLAHGRYRVVVGAAVVSLLYVMAINWNGDRILALGPDLGLKRVVVIIGVSNVLLLAVAAWFSRAALKENAPLQSGSDSR